MGSVAVRTLGFGRLRHMRRANRRRRDDEAWLFLQRRKKRATLVPIMNVPAALAQPILGVFGQPYVGRVDFDMAERFWNEGNLHVIDDLILMYTAGRWIIQGRVR